MRRAAREPSRAAGLRIRAARLGVALLLAAGCAEPSPPRGVVIVLVDTLRADHLGCYGYDRPTSPRLDAFAARATRFETVVSPSPWTLPSVASLMTSLYPSVHGARFMSDTIKRAVAPDAFRPVSVLAGERRTLAEMLRDAGFRTAAFVQGAYPSREFGLAQGFERFADNDGPGIRFNVERALAWLDELRGERFFVYLHVVEVHAPYAFRPLPERFAERHPDAPLDYYRRALEEEQRRWEEFDFDPDYEGSVDGSRASLTQLHLAAERPPERDRRHLVALYDQSIAYTDYWIGKLLDGLERRGLADETAVVVTSDHGEEFYEHGGLEHSRTYFEEVLRVPLLLRVPGLAEGEVVREPVSLLDVLPTLLEALALERPAGLQGRSLLPLLRGETIDAVPHFAEAAADRRSFGVRTEGWKYLRFGSGRETLFDLERDPGERVDRCRVDPETCRSLRRALAEWRREMGRAAAEGGRPSPRPAELDEATRERLEALGYADPGEPRSGGSRGTP